MSRTASLLVLLHFCLVLLKPAAFGFVITDLGGNWTLVDADGVYKPMEARVPGGVYTDLMENGLIGDPFYGTNDTATRWVAQVEWNYSRNFTVNSTQLNHSNVNLVFDGIDTFAAIFVNGRLVGESDNMFVRYVFDAKPFLKLGSNTLSVLFKSPIAEATKLFEEQAKNYTVVPLCVPEGYHGECHVNHIRKMQASFAWDWGPAFPSVGIWKRVYLEAYNSTVVRDVTVFIEPNDKDDSWGVNVTSYFATKNRKGLLQGTLSIRLFTDVTVVEQIEKLNVTLDQNEELAYKTSFSVPKTNVQLWWPNGYGDQKLYVLKVTFVNADETEQHVKRIKVGFRTIDLVQDSLSGSSAEDGRMFYFKVNDIPIFAKGTNSIPIDILPERSQNRSTIRFLMESAKSVHMNMMRVWGGGLYESDYLYELADEFGILIWQDFMFACSMYPTNKDFLRTVEEEVAHQVKRLQHHASIAVWAGNNENEAALRQNWYGTAKNFTVYKNDYVKLYVDTVRAVYRKYDNKPYLTSSPTNGIESDRDGYVADNPQSNYYGDVHFYNYLSDGWESNIYPITRFASEYGYQGMPSVDSWLSAIGDVTLLHPESDFMRHRQHHPLGNTGVRLLIDKQLTLPAKTHPNYYSAFIYYSQIIQAMSVKIETELYRQWRSDLNSNGEGMTMGALYWQLNDVWVAPSWAGIDYKNRWKMLHYYAKNFFAPVLVTPHLDVSREMQVYVVSDLTTPIYNATIYVDVYNWVSQVALPNRTVIKTDILPGKSTRLSSIFVDEYLSKTGCGVMAVAKENCFFYMTAMDARNNSLGPNNFLFPTEIKYANRQWAKVTISAIRQVERSSNEFDIDIKSDAIALFVWLDSHNIHGLFEENGFVMVDKLKTVRFQPQQTVSLSEMQKTITVTHLMDEKYFPR